MHDLDQLRKQRSQTEEIRRGLKESLLRGLSSLARASSRAVKPPKRGSRLAPRPSGDSAARPALIAPPSPVSRKVRSHADET